LIRFDYNIADLKSDGVDGLSMQKIKVHKISTGYEKLLKDLSEMRIQVLQNINTCCLHTFGYLIISIYGYFLKVFNHLFVHGKKWQLTR